MSEHTLSVIQGYNVHRRWSCTCGAKGSNLAYASDRWLLELGAEHVKRKLKEN